MHFIIDSSLELKQLQLEDSKHLFAVTNANRDYLAKWLAWVKDTRSVQDTEKFIRNTIFRYENKGELVCGIWFENSLIGTIGLIDVDKKDRKTELGYWLAQEYQGKGIMTKAVKVFLQYAFEELKLHRVQILVAVENKKSQAIPERLGFTKEGILRGNAWLYDHFEDHIVYSLLDHEFQREIKAR